MFYLFQDVLLNDDTNGYDNIDDFTNLSIQPESKNGVENAPVNNQSIIHNTIMEEVIANQYFEQFCRTESNYENCFQITTERGNNIIISVTEPQKVGDGMSSYVAYKILTKTNMPIFQKQNFTVSRRFSDFLGLHEKLSEKYLKTGRIIPPAPEKSVIGMLF